MTYFRHLYQASKEQNILVRYFDLPKLKNKLRITVGTDSQNLKLIEAIEAELQQNWDNQRSIVNNK